MNAAAADLCLKNVGLLDRRGELLQLARKKVAEEGYNFKKGHSRSKLYGKPQSDSTPKRAKYNQDMREERMATVEEELSDVARMMQFKEKRRSQAEAGKNYRACEQITEELMVLKSRKRELEAEKCLLIRKARRAKQRKQRENKQESDESSDIDADNLSSSRCSTSRSVTPVCSHKVVPSARRASLSSSLSPTHSLDLEQGSSAGGGPLSPFNLGTRINPVDCESDSAQSDDPTTEPSCVGGRNPHF